MERLTKVDKPNLKSQMRGDNITPNESTAIKRLWKYENVMEKYGIKNIDELYVRLDKTLVEWRNEVDKDFKEMLEEDRDTWKKACELAVIWIAEEIKVFPKDSKENEYGFWDNVIISENVDYFYQQAKGVRNANK